MKIQDLGERVPIFYAGEYDLNNDPYGKIIAKLGRDLGSFVKKDVPKGSTYVVDLENISPEKTFIQATLITQMRSDYPFNIKMYISGLSDQIKNSLKISAIGAPLEGRILEC
ncbi:MAG: hypothetical protein V1888_04230 [archaeon]